jgi:hypothetical protein
MLERKPACERALALLASGGGTPPLVGLLALEPEVI